MNLDEYIKKNELGEFDIEQIEKFSQNQSIGTILRLYTSHGEASKIGIYNDDSLNWAQFKEFNNSISPDLSPNLDLNRV